MPSTILTRTQPLGSVCTIRRQREYGRARMTLASGIEVSPERLAAICGRYRVSELAVFGSAARGEMRPESDVDVLVEFEPGTHPGLGFFQLEEELSGLFGRRVDLGRKSLLKPLVRPSVLRDAVVLYAA